MGHKQIRLGQLIAPFGPASIYTDRRGVPHVVCGLDHWHERWDPTQGARPCDSPDEFVMFEPRLTRLLRVPTFKRPPDYRRPSRNANPPPNANLQIPAQRFPCWYRNTKTGLMKRVNLDTRLVDNPGGGARWQPVRFIAVCHSGHLCDFPWKEWAECTCADEGRLVLTDTGGSDLSSITVYCEACGGPGKKRSLSRVTQRPDPGEQSQFGEKGIRCPGQRPWLGAGADEACGEELVGALINQTNVYFPRTVSAILLPEVDEVSDVTVKLRQEISSDASVLPAAKMMWDMKQRGPACAAVANSLSVRGIAATSAEIEQALAGLFDPSSAVDARDARPADPESEMLSFRRAEYNILRREMIDPKRSRDLRVVPAAVPEQLSSWISRVRLVERLKETRVFFGFDRLEPQGNFLDGLPEKALRQLFRDPPDATNAWLPAIEVFGEGVYLELSDEAITKWQRANRDWLEARLSDQFISRIAGQFQTLPPSGGLSRSWASRYLLVHTLSHALINQMVFECGYSTAALRERLYVSADTQAPMAGILIYTAAGDSEGTLGGLVRLGRPERLGQVFQRALGRASWCSADPVCSENLGGQGSRLANLGACHSCVLLPETACETINHGLDRATVVGTPDDRTRGAFSHLVEAAVGMM